MLRWKSTGVIALIALLTLAGTALANEQPVDLGVTKVLNTSNGAIAYQAYKVTPSEVLGYNGEAWVLVDAAPPLVITVTYLITLDADENPDSQTVNWISDIHITDKLAPGAVLNYSGGQSVWVKNDTYTFNVVEKADYEDDPNTYDGYYTFVEDLLTVYLKAITAEYPLTISVAVDYPASIAPDTLYNSVLVRARNDNNMENNYATFSIPVYTAYDERYAMESFEDLLKYQYELTASFEDLVKTVPMESDDYSMFIKSFENLLRRQADLYESFEELLYNDAKTGWNERLDTRRERAVFLKSLEDLLRYQAFLFMSFESTLKTESNNNGAPVWVENIPDKDKMMFLASFEDLLKKEVALYKNFATLEKKLDEGISSDAIGGDLNNIDWQNAKVDLLASFEDLLRLQSNLLFSFEDLIKATTTWPLEDESWDVLHDLEVGR